jgi:hypothetical protein
MTLRPVRVGGTPAVPLKEVAREVATLKRFAARNAKQKRYQLSVVGPEQTDVLGKCEVPASIILS